MKSRDSSAQSYPIYTWCLVVITWSCLGTKVYFRVVFYVEQNGNGVNSGLISCCLCPTNSRSHFLLGYQNMKTNVLSSLLHYSICLHCDMVSHQDTLKEMRSLLFGYSLKYGLISSAGKKEEMEVLLLLAFACAIEICLKGRSGGLTFVLTNYQYYSQDYLQDTLSKGEIHIHHSLFCVN